MNSRKRNEFLDIESSDEDAVDRGYDSEAAEESKGWTAKRRRLNVDEDQSSGSEEEVKDDEVDQAPEKPHTRRKSKQSPDLGGEGEDEDEEEKENDEPSESQAKRKLEQKSKGSTKPKLLDKPPKKNRTGVVYLSSLPPYLKPMALKTLLVQRGFEPITRVFLTPAVHSTSASRRSNRRKTYTDGWVEFSSKKTAKICATTLNATVVGGKKGGWYHDDVWNMKYLTGFKWDDLMEQVQRERSEREARRRIEDARSRKEDKIFLAGVEQGKVMEGIRKKREEKGKAGQSVLDPETEATSNLPVRRVFRQNEVKTKGNRDSSALGGDTKRVLSKIF